jgi:hypothetical protein
MANEVTTLTLQKEINGVIYRTRHMDPESVLQHAGRIFGMSAGSVLAKSASDSGLMGVLKDCFELASADGKELRGKAWNVHFLGKQKDMVQLVAWLLEVHFADFFVEAVNVGKGLKERFGELLESKESTPA